MLLGEYSSALKWSEAGATNLVDRMPPVCEDVALGPVTNGIWMSLPQDQRSHPLSLASGRPERRCARYSRPAKTEPICCRPFLPQAVARHGAPPMRARYRQTAQLRRGETDCTARRCSSANVGIKQPSRELSSTDARAGEANAPVQICSARPAFCRGAQHYRFALPPPTPSILRQLIIDNSVVNGCGLERGHRDRCPRITLA